jgi:hypothetical protein
MLLSDRTHYFPMKHLPWDAKYQVAIQSNLMSSTLFPMLTICPLNILWKCMIG